MYVCVTNGASCPSLGARFGELRRIEKDAEREAKQMEKHPFYGKGTGKPATEIPEFHQFPTQPLHAGDSFRAACSDQIP